MLVGGWGLASPVIGSHHQAMVRGAEFGESPHELSSLSRFHLWKSVWVDGRCQSPEGKLDLLGTRVWSQAQRLQRACPYRVLASRSDSWLRLASRPLLHWRCVVPGVPKWETAPTRPLR